MQRKFLIISSIIFIVTTSCNSYPTDTSYKSDMTKNSEALQKRTEAEKAKTEISWENNFGKPK